MLMSAGSDLGDGDVDVFGGTLAGVGTVGPTTLHEDGTIAPGTDGTGTLTIDGDYTGNGGTLLTETVLGGDASDTDLLFIEGDTTLGTAPTQVSVTNLGGSGAQTNEGIRIVQVEGASAPGLFELNGDTVVNGNEAVIGGAYAYSLFQGSVSDPLDGDWYLRSFGFSPTAAPYEAYPSAMLGLVELPTLQQRVGDRRYFAATGGGAGPASAKGQANESTGYSGGRNLWVRIEGSHRHMQGDSTTGTDHDSNRYLVQLGLDGMLTDDGSGVVIGGINAQYAHLDTDISSDSGDGDVSADSFGLGATLTWYGDGGGYLDAQGLAAYQTGDVSSDAVGKLVDDNEGWGYAIGVEAGRKIGLRGNWGITPQAQLSYTSVGFDDFTDPFGAEVSLDSGDSLKHRIGVAVDYDAFDAGTGSRRHFYTIANLIHKFLDGTSAM